MPHYYPVVVPGGKSLAGDSLGFHAYSLRIDNLTNQWLLEETSLAWIPPYSLGVCLRLYGTGVGIILNQAPVGQPQLQPIPGEQTVGVYSDQLRTEVGGTPVRQFSLVQTVSDLTQGAVPASPPVGITRLYASPDGSLHYILSSGTTYQLIDSNNIATYVGPQPLGGDLYGTINNGGVSIQYGHTIYMRDSGGTSHGSLGYTGDNWMQLNAGTAGFEFANAANTVRIWQIDNNGNVTMSGALVITNGDINAYRGGNPATGLISFGQSAAHYLWFDGSEFVFSANAPVYVYGLNLQGQNIGAVNDINCGSVSILQGSNQVIYWRDGAHYLQYAPAGNTSLLYFTHDFQANNLQARSILNVQGATSSFNMGGNANGYVIEVPNSASKAGQPLAQAYATYSSVEHAQQFGLPIAGIDDPIGKLTAIKPLYYQHATINEHGEAVRRSTGEIEASYTYGFSARDLQSILPELVGLSPKGEPIAINYDRLLTVLWSAVQNLESRLTGAGL